jgi:hypothetical protein
MHIESHVSTESQEQILDLGVGPARVPLWLRLWFLVTRYYYETLIGLHNLVRLRRCFAQPAQRPTNRISLGCSNCPDDGLAIIGPPSGGRAPKRPGPSVRVLQTTKHRQLIAHVQYGHASLRRKRNYNFDRNPTWEDLRLPDWFLILEHLSGHFQNPHPARNPG